MNRALVAHSALAALRVPTDLALAPDGKALACVLPPIEDSAAAGLIHVLPVGSEGVEAARPLRVEGAPAGHAMVRWLPDGTLLFATPGPTGELTRLLLVDASQLAAEPLSPESSELHAAVLWQVDLPGVLEDVMPAAGAALLRLADPGSHRDGSHLGTRVGPAGDPMVDVPGQALRRLALLNLTDRVLTPVDCPLGTVWDAHWAGGHTVVAVVSEDPRPAGFYRPQLVTIDVVRQTTQVLYTTQWQLACPRVSPDGRTAVVAEGLSIVSGQVLEIGLDTGAVHRWEGLDDITDLGWLDSETLWFAGWDGTGSKIGTARVGGRVTGKWWAPGSATGPTGQPGVVVGVDRRAYAVWEGRSQPPEVSWASLDQAPWRPVTGVNVALTELAEGTSQTEVTWTADDGQVIGGLLLVDTTVPAPAAGRPLVVMAHGGPTWLWAQSFAPAESAYLALPLTAAGAAVLLPNPRGSSGRGQAYARAIIGTMGSSDLSDVFAGVDELIAQGIVDSSRVAMMGLSYGGYLSALAAATGSRLRCAVVMSGVADWLGFRTASNLGGGYDVLYHDGADPLTVAGREALAARSPLYRVGPTTAPTLLLHGQDDQVTPVGQAQQLHQALVSAGVPTELVIYPREGHELVEWPHRRDAARRAVEWLTRHGVLQ